MFKWIYFREGFFNYQLIINVTSSNLVVWWSLICSVTTTVSTVWVSTDNSIVCLLLSWRTKINL